MCPEICPEICENFCPEIFLGLCSGLRLHGTMKISLFVIFVLVVMSWKDCHCHMLTDAEVDSLFEQ